MLSSLLVSLNWNYYIIIPKSPKAIGCNNTNIQPWGDFYLMKIFRASMFGV
jgi:hypothetical protein